MKKYFMLASAIFSIGAAVANPPKIGDFAKYQMTLQHKDGTSEQMILTFQLTSYDPATLKGSAETTTVFVTGPTAGQSMIATTTIDSADQSDAINNCALANGVLEFLNVGEKGVQACHWTLGDANESQFWVGNVPFGIVKMVTIDPTSGDTTTEILIDSHFGN